MCKLNDKQKLSILLGQSKFLHRLLLLSIPLKSATKSSETCEENKIGSANGESFNFRIFKRTNSIQ
jgi:hypothetical protein